MIELCDVTKVYGSLWHPATWALRGVSFSTVPGEVVNIWGPPGAGKSTLLKVLGLRTRLTGELYLLDGTDVSALSHGERARRRERMVATTWCDRELPGAARGQGAPVPAWPGQRRTACPLRRGLG